MKAIITNVDGSTVELFDQAYIDAAVAAALTTPVVTPEDVEVELLLSDGSKKTFVPKI
jgi:hypothetical protein